MYQFFKNRKSVKRYLASKAEQVAEKVRSVFLAILRFHSILTQWPKKYLNRFAPSALRASIALENNHFFLSLKYFR